MIIFLNGASNTGKTTIAHLLQKKIEDSIVIEIDPLIREFHHLSPRSSLVNGIEKGLALIKKVTEESVCVIVPFPLSQAHYNYFIDHLQPISQLYFFTLSPSLEVALSNRGERSLSPTEKQRIQKYYQDNLNEPKFGITINTSKQTAEQTTELIVNYLNLKN